MEDMGQRCECTLGLEEATKGELPGVCARCGEATNQFRPTMLSYGGRRVRLCLPICGAHKAHGRKSLPLILFIVGVSLFVLGLCLFLAIVAADLAAAGVWQALALTGLGGVGL